jgi:translation initiation factor 3 subunit C
MSRFFRQAADSDSESSDSEESLLSSDEDASPAKSAAPAKPAMSRFLRTANASDSSSSSSSESESEDGDESDDEGAAHKEAKPKSRFLRDSDEEESDEEVKRVVKSARDKRLEEMEATGKAMDNALKINDWIAISSGRSLFHVLLCAARRSLCSTLEYDKLARMVQRQQNVAEPVPPFYIRTLISLEVALNAALAKEKEAKKKMNASNARALTAMKQKVRKTVKEHEKEIKQYNDVYGFYRLLVLLAAYCLPGSGGI